MPVCVKRIVGEDGLYRDSFLFHAPFNVSLNRPLFRYTRFSGAGASSFETQQSCSEFWRQKVLCIEIKYWGIWK